MMKYDEESFLKEILSISSVNGADSERNAAVFIKDFLQECGVQAGLQEIDGRRANVVAVLNGRTEEKVIWNGHLDTVPYGKLSEWDTDPAVPVKKNGCYYARGASDMKGGLAAMAWTLGFMKMKNRIPKQTILFCGTCDEEKGGTGAKVLLESGALDHASFLMIGEPTGLRPGVAQKGCLWLKLRVHGRTSHGAYPEEGINAVHYGIRIFEDLRERIEKGRHKILGTSTAQISGIRGGIAPNMTPDEAELTFDIRMIPGLNGEKVLAFADEIIGRYKEQTKGALRTEVYVENERAAIEIAENSSWVKRLDRELERRELPYEHMGINYFTDASVLIRQLPELPVLLFGPGNPEMAHKPNEYLELKKYLEYIRILLQLF